MRSTRDTRTESFQCQSLLLAEREHTSRFRGSIGYTFGNIMSFERVETLVSHKGCVNTMKWSKDGTKLITGSDDKCVKIWNHQNSAEGTTLRHTIHTGHRSNIFCADFSRSCESLIVSCAADGTLYKNDINSTSAEVKLMKSDGLMWVVDLLSLLPHLTVSNDSHIFFQGICSFLDRKSVV